MVLCALTTHQPPAIRFRKGTSYTLRGFSEHQYLVLRLFTFLMSLKYTSPKTITNFLIKFLSITENVTENPSTPLYCILLYDSADIYYIYIFLISVYISYMTYTLLTSANKEPSFNSVQISTLRNVSKPYKDHA
jgi:hypothetical protein